MSLICDILTARHNPESRKCEFEYLILKLCLSLELKSLEVLILRDKCYTVYCFLLEEKIATNLKSYNAI